jgi:U3 small nucleolar RNA-associated protein 20
MDDDTIRDLEMGELLPFVSLFFPTDNIVIIDELKTLAAELQDLVQSKVGTTKFSVTYNQIRQSVLGIRRERKVTRALQFTTNPEAVAKRKLQRNLIKKENRKRKHRGFAYVSCSLVRNVAYCHVFDSEGKGRLKKRREE